jgi:hypothetical protein
MQHYAFDFARPDDPSGPFPRLSEMRKILAIQPPERAGLSLRQFVHFLFSAISAIFGAVNS